MRSQLPQFQETRKIRIGVLTWNLAGNAPPNRFDLSQIVLPENLTTSANYTKQQNQELAQLFDGQTETSSS